MISIRSGEGRGALASSTSNELVHSPQRTSHTSGDFSSSLMVLADRALSTFPRRGSCPFPNFSLSFSAILRGTCPAAALRNRRFNVVVVPTFASRVDDFPPHVLLHRRALAGRRADVPLVSTCAAGRKDVSATGTEGRSDAAVAMGGAVGSQHRIHVLLESAVERHHVRSTRRRRDVAAAISCARIAVVRRKGRWPCIRGAGARLANANVN